MSVGLQHFNTSVLPSPLVLRFDVDLVLLGNQTTAQSCVFLDEFVSAWRRSGVNTTIVSTNGSVFVTECSSSHMTNFAVLFALPSSEPLSGSAAVALEVTTYVGCIVSMVGTILTFVTFALFRKLRTLPAVLIMNLCVAIFATNLVFLAGINQTSNAAACKAVAIILQYFLLAMFSWMLMVGVQLVRSLHGPMASSVADRSTLFWYTLIGWLSPAVYVAVCVLIDSFRAGWSFGYGDSERCWITTTGGLVAGVLVPAGVVIIVNFIVFFVAVHRLSVSVGFRKQSGSEDDMPVSLQLGIYLTLLITLGVTWILGYFALLEPVFWFAFVAIDSFQGAFIFVAFVCRRRVLQYWAAFCTRGHVQLPPSTAPSTRYTSEPPSAPRREASVQFWSAAAPETASGRPIASPKPRRSPRMLLSRHRQQPTDVLATDVMMDRLRANRAAASGAGSPTSPKTSRVLYAWCATELEPGQSVREIGDPSRDGHDVGSPDRAAARDRPGDPLPAAPSSTSRRSEVPIPDFDIAVRAGRLTHDFRDTFQIVMPTSTSSADTVVVAPSATEGAVVPQTLDTSPTMMQLVEEDGDFDVSRVDPHEWAQIARTKSGTKSAMQQALSETEPGSQEEMRVLVRRFRQRWASNSAMRVLQRVDEAQQEAAPVPPPSDPYADEAAGAARDSRDWTYFNYFAAKQVIDDALDQSQVRAAGVSDAEVADARMALERAAGVSPSAAAGDATAPAAAAAATEVPAASADADQVSIDEQTLRRLEHLATMQFDNDAE